MGKGDGKGERERGKRKKEGLCGELLKAELSLIFYLSLLAVSCSLWDLVP